MLETMLTKTVAPADGADTEENSDSAKAAEPSDKKQTNQQAANQDLVTKSANKHDVAGQKKGPQPSQQLAPQTAPATEATHSLDSAKAAEPIASEQTKQQATNQDLAMESASKHDTAEQEKDPQPSQQLAPQTAPATEATHSLDSAKAAEPIASEQTNQQATNQDLAMESASKHDTAEQEKDPQPSQQLAPQTEEPTQEATKDSAPSEPSNVSSWRLAADKSVVQELDELAGWDRSADDTHFIVEMPESYVPLKVYDSAPWLGLSEYMGMSQNMGVVSWLDKLCAFFRFRGVHGCSELCGHHCGSGQKTKLGSRCHPELESDWAQRESSMLRSQAQEQTENFIRRSAHI